MIPTLVGLGSNLGNRFYFLRAALQHLQPWLHQIRYSSIYETEPVGFRQQPLFLNMVIFGYTSLPLPLLFDALKQIERALEQRPHFHGRAREIDIDLLLYGYRQYSSPHLIVPHPRMHQRRFVLTPAAEVAPEMLHPVLGFSIAALHRRCSDSSAVQRWIQAETLQQLLEY